MRSRLEAWLNRRVQQDLERKLDKCETPEDFVEAIAKPPRWFEVFMWLVTPIKWGILSAMRFYRRHLRR